MTNSETKNFSQNVSSSYHLGGKCSDECKKDSLNVPKLRFKGYNEEWKQNKLGNLFEIKAGGDIDNKKLSKNKNEQYKYPVYANALQNNGLYGYSDIYKISGETITVTGRGDVGHAIARKENYYPIVRLLILKPIVKQDVDFWANAINNTRIFVESTGVPQLTAPQLAKIKIYYPSLPEQEKIAEFLTLIDKKIEKQKELVELLKKYKRGLLSQIFSQKLRFKDDNGNYYPNWEEKRLEEILKIKHGKSQKEIECTNGKYPILATSGKIGKTNAYLWDKPCVLIGRKGTIDKPQYMDTPFWTVDTLFYSEVFKENNAKYLYYLFYTINWKKYDESTGVPSLSAKSIERIKVTLSIDYSEQLIISKILSTFDNKIQQEKCILNYLQTYKKGLLQQMFI